MSYTNLKKLAAVVACACFMSISTHAVTIDSSRLLGDIMPSQPNSVANEMVQVNFLVDAYNFSPAARSLGDNPLDPQTENYDLTPGSVVLTQTILATATAGSKTDTSNGAGIDVTGWSYLIGKYGNNSWVYYVGDLTGTVDLPNTFGRAGLSHYTLFDPPATNSVPDGGATLALLGMGLTGLSVVARRFKK